MMLRHCTVVIISTLLCLSFSQVYAAICPGFFDQPVLTNSDSLTGNNSNESDLSVESVINITMQNNISPIVKRQTINTKDVGVLEQLFFYLMFKFEHGRNGYGKSTVYFDNYPQLQDKAEHLDVIKDEIFAKIFGMYQTSPYYRWFSIDDSDEFNFISKKMVPTQSYSRNEWATFMSIFAQILNSKSLLEFRKSPPKEVYDHYLGDWGFDYGSYVAGSDDKINKLLEMLYYDNLPEDTRRFRSHNSILKEKALREDRVKVLKNIVAMFAVYLSSMGTGKDVDSDWDNVFKPYWVNAEQCTATIVSSNTLITAAHCLSSLVPGDRVEVRIGGKVYHSVGFYIDPDYLIQSATGKINSEADVGVVRFPEGTFLGIKPSKVGFSGLSPKGTLITTDRLTDKRFVLNIDQEDFGINRAPSLDSYKSVTKTSIKDSGSPIFNEANEFVGFVRGSIGALRVIPGTQKGVEPINLEYPVSTMLREPDHKYVIDVVAHSFSATSVQYFFKLVSLVDPKINIKGLTFK